MKFKSVILPIAKEDLLQAAKWYNQANPKLGKQLLKRVHQRIIQLKTHPFTCQIRYSEVHTAIVEQFPYLIHYFVDQQNKNIVIISILHTSQSPEIWDDRTEQT